MFADTETWARRLVGGGELFLRRRDSRSLWEISFWESTWSTGSAFVGGAWLHSKRLAGRHFEGRTFGSPEEAVVAVAKLLGA